MSISARALVRKGLVSELSRQMNCRYGRNHMRTPNTPISRSRSFSEFQYKYTSFRHQERCNSTQRGMWISPRLDWGGSSLRNGSMVGAIVEASFVTQLREFLEILKYANERALDPITTKENTLFHQVEETVHSHGRRS